MKVYVDLTDNEERALLSALLYASRACQSTCVYEEMKTKSTDCINCPYEKGIDSLRRKFSKPKSLADYTKQVRKEVLGELMNMLGDRAELIQTAENESTFMFDTYDLTMCVEEILGEEKGETECQKN